MTDPIEPDAPGADVTAGELALGLLEGQERAAALRRQLAEPAFARDVERWRANFALLFAAVPGEAPPAELGERVIARLDGPARSPARFWKPFAIAASLAAAGLLGMIVTRPEPVVAPAAAPTQAPLVAAFTIDGQKAPLLAVYDRQRGSLSMPGPMPVPAGRSAQLWAIVGAAPPQPLGLFHQAAGRVVADARTARPFAPGTTLAISIEPLGGSPTGLPTGPVVGSGTLTEV